MNPVDISTASLSAIRSIVKQEVAAALARQPAPNDDGEQGPVDTLVDGPNEHGAVRSRLSLLYTENWILSKKFPGSDDMTLEDKQDATIMQNCGCDYAGNIGPIGPLTSRIKPGTAIVGLCYDVASTRRDEETGKLFWTQGHNGLPKTIANRYTETGEVAGPCSWDKLIAALRAGVLD